MAEKELELELKEAGTRLCDPPGSVDELLQILDKLESSLKKVEQSPSDSMKNAMGPSMEALTQEKIREHPDVDVKVAAASCVSEITRITAPDAPFEDEQMRELFKLIVTAFEKLDDTSSRSYSKRVSILETLAKVRSCVVMLDLECDELILQMFQHFLNSIRESHEEAVSSSMETVMSLVLDENEDVNTDLVSLLLDSMKKDNQDILPVARGLAERVFSDCATKLKPYLLESVKSMTLSLNDYSDIVATICQEIHDAGKPNDGNSSGEHVVAKELEPQSACTHEIDPSVKQSPRLVTSNGNAPIENDNASTGVSSPKEKPELSDTGVQSAEGGETNNLENQPVKLESNNLESRLVKSEANNLESQLVKSEANNLEQLVKSETKSDQSSKKKRGRKPNSSKQSAGVSGDSHVEGDEESSDMPDGQKDQSKVVNSSYAEDQSVGGEIMPSEDGKESQSHGSSPTVPLDNTANISSSYSQNTPEGNRPKRGRPPRKKKESLTEQIDSGLPSSVKSDQQTEVELSKSPDVVPTEKAKVDIEAKSSQRSGRKASARDKDDGLVLPPADVANKDSGAASDLVDYPQKRSGKKVDAKESNENKLSGKKDGGKTKKGRAASSSEKDVADDTIIKKKLSSPKAKSKSGNKNERALEETPQTGFKRKRTSLKEEQIASMQQKIVGETDENLVGRKIKVWWPDDEAFYPGVVQSFDPVHKKHKVFYEDGDEEVLVLSKENWHFVGDEEEAPSPSDPETSRKKKVKTSDSPTSQSEDTKGKGVSSGKTKGRPPGKSGGKPKDDNSNPSTKTIDETPKTASKAKSGSGKAKGTPKASKPKDDSPKTEGKSKDDVDMPKTGGAKSKDNKGKAGSSSKSPKAGTKTKANANGTSAKGKSSASKVEETEELKKGSGKGKKRESEDSAKGKSLDSGDGKSGKKRRKGST